MKDIAVVTGASRGIGMEIAQRLKEQYFVVGLSRSFAAEPPGSIAFCNCDITDAEDVKKIFKGISKIVSIPKILINCAGYVEPKSIIETTPEEWDYQIRVNLTGAFLCTKEFLKYNRSGGKIINIASTAGARPSPGWAAYGAAKAGLINFSLSLSEELKPYGIKVYCVNPGRCATELRRKMAPDEDQGRIMQPEDVARFVAYLVKEETGLLDGQALRVRKDFMEE